MQSDIAKFEFKNHPQALLIGPLFKLIEDELHDVEHLHSQLKYIDQLNQAQCDLRPRDTDEYFDLRESVITFPQRRLNQDQVEDPDEVNGFLYQIKTQGTDETQAQKVFECCGKRWATGQALGGHRQKSKTCLTRRIRRRNEF